MAIERRDVFGERLSIERRDDGASVIVGYGAVFYVPGDKTTEYELWKGPGGESGAVERIRAGCFSRAIREKQDCRGLYNHDDDYVLGRVGNGTLRLMEDQKGLRYEVDAIDANDVQDLCKKIGRGDIPGSSFSFVPTRVTWETDKATGMEIRWIEDCDLFDVGPVTYPAYSATTTAVRSQDGESARSEFEAIKATKEWEAKQARNREVWVRLRLLEIANAEREQTERNSPRFLTK